MSGVLSSAMQSKRLGMTSKSLLVLLCMCALRSKAALLLVRLRTAKCISKLHTAWLEASQSHQTVKHSLRDEYFEVNAVVIGCTCLEGRRIWRRDFILIV